MGYSLDQLLDETGATKLPGVRSSMKKTASEKFSFAKLAERCRKAVDATPEEQTDSEHQTLAEKTAAVQIIRQTMAEIDAILGHGPAQVKTAAPKAHALPVEDFIKAALDKGHSPEAIAAFLQKEGGLLSSIGGRIHEMRAGHAVNKAKSLAGKAEATGDKAYRMWEDRVRKASSLGDRERDAVVSRMRVALGDENAAKLLSENSSFKNLPSAKGLKRPADPSAAARGGEHAVGMSVGGMKAGISPEQLKKMKTPALAVGAGFLGHKAMTQPKDESTGKKKGVVVINS